MLTQGLDDVARELQRRGQRLLLVAVQPGVRAVLQAAGLDDSLFCDDLGDDLGDDRPSALIVQGTAPATPSSSTRQ